MKPLPILLSSVFVAPFLVQTMTLNPSAASTNHGDTQIPISFVKRMMNFGSQDSQLWVGSLPDQLPVELPKLPNAQVMGSRSRKDRFFDFLTIHLDTKESPEQVQAFYQAQLSVGGWTQATVQKPRKPLPIEQASGDGKPQRSLHFCHSAQEMALTITTHSGTNSVTEINLTLTPSKNSQFCQTKKEQDLSVEEVSKQMLSQLKTQLESQLKLAAIAAPPGSQVFPLDSGSLGDTLIRTSLDPQSLAEHYETQMRLTGWTYRDRGSDRNLSWSTWTTIDSQGTELMALLSSIADSNLPEVTLFKDEQAEASDSGAIYLASQSAALPNQKSRQYLVSLSLFQLNQPESEPKPQRVPRSPAQRQEPIKEEDARGISQNLAFRFLGPGFKGNLFPNQLPPQLPTPFPLLSSAKLVGSWVNEKGEAVLFFDVPSSAQAIHQFYQGQVVPLKWVDFSAESTRFSQAGFLEPKEGYQLDEPDGDGLQFVFLCDRQRQVEIVLQTWDQSATSTEFRVDLRPDSDNCKQSDEEDNHQSPLEHATKHIPIPVLIAPPNTQVSQGSESADKNFYSQQAGIASETQTGEALARHYEQQMQQQGWRSNARYSTRLIYLSLWQLTDQQGNQWHSLLKFVRSQPASDAYAADLTLLKNQD